jgi:uncharacterized protein (TIGR03437 family)
LPLGFEANIGQADPEVRFLARDNAAGLFLTAAEVVVHLPGPRPATVRMRLLGGNPAPVLEALDLLPGRSHYFLGGKPRRWKVNVPRYGRIRYREVYPGVDLVFHGRSGRLEFDFEVAAGADPRVIRLGFRGVEKIHLNDEGDLLLRTRDGDIRQSRPLVYQEVNGVRKVIEGRHEVKGRRVTGFRIDSFDRGLPLVIDPVLTYSTFLGGSGPDDGLSLATDASGNVYVAGSTSSSNFPLSGALQPAYRGSSDIFVAKLNSTGTALVYATYLGGLGADSARALAVDGAGNVYLTGRTTSSDFPTLNAFQPTYRGGGGLITGDAFVTKLNANGAALVYSTFLGGGSGDVGNGIAVDSSGAAYVIGGTESTNFPTASPLQASNAGGTRDAFVTKLAPSGSALVYSTYLGGGDYDEGVGIAVDTAGNATIAGSTQYSRFPTTPGAYQTTDRGGIGEGFVAKLNAAGSALVYSTLLGGNSNDTIYAMAVDSFGRAVVTGYTGSTNYPTQNPIQANARGDLEAFVTKLNATGTGLVFSTYLGGSGVRDDIGLGVTVDNFGHTFVTGYTESLDFPTANALQGTHGGGACGTFLGSTRNCADVFLARLSPSGSSFVYSTFLGGAAADRGQGLALDSAGNAYVAGFANSTNFPVTTGAFRTTYGGSQDAFVVKITDGAAAGPVATSVSAASYGASVLAANAIASVFGQGLAAATQVAEALPLPTRMGDTAVTVTDSAGTERAASLFFASPGQINYLVPAETAAGLATVKVTRGGAVVAQGALQVETVSPGLFAANANGRGVAAAQVVRVRADGSQATEEVFRFDAAQGRSVAVPIDLGPETDQVVLVLFGTGVRSRSDLAAVSALLGNEVCQVQFAGPQGGFVGLDQVNVLLSRRLIGRGEVEVALVVDGKQANPVTVTIR